MVRARLGWRALEQTDRRRPAPRRAWARRQEQTDHHQPLAPGPVPAQPLAPGRPPQPEQPDERARAPEQRGPEWLPAREQTGHRTEQEQQAEREQPDEPGRLVRRELVLGRRARPALVQVAVPESQARAARERAAPVPRAGREPARPVPRQEALAAAEAAVGAAAWRAVAEELPARQEQRPVPRRVATRRRTSPADSSSIAPAVCDKPMPCPRSTFPPPPRPGRNGSIGASLST